MVDMRTVDGTQKALGGIYPFTGLYVDAHWLASHKQHVRAKNIVGCFSSLNGRSRTPNRALSIFGSVEVFVDLSTRA
jgi:hypothetical protein